MIDERYPFVGEKRRVYCLIDIKILLYVIRGKYIFLVKYLFLLHAFFSVQ